MKIDRKAILFEMADKARRRYYENEEDSYEDPVLLADQVSEMDTPEYSDPMIINQEEDPVVIVNNDAFEEDEPEYIPVEEEEDDDEYVECDITKNEEDDPEYIPVEEEEDDEDDIYFEGEDEYGNPIEIVDEDDEEYQQAVDNTNKEAETAVESRHLIKSINKKLSNYKESYRVYKVNSIKKTKRGLVAECITKDLRTNKFKRSSVLVQGYNRFYEKKAPSKKKH